MKKVAGVYLALPVTGSRPAFFHRYVFAPSKLHFHIPCVFPVRPQIFPVPIYVVCDYYIDKTDLADLSNFWKKMDIFAGNLQLEQTQFPVFSLSYGKISLFGHFPCFLCVVGTLSMCLPIKGTVSSVMF